MVIILEIIYRRKLVRSTLISSAQVVRSNPVSANDPDVSRRELLAAHLLHKLIIKFFNFLTFTHVPVQS
jgi:hypothetical protein